MLSLINLIEDKNNGYKGTLNDPNFSSNINLFSIKKLLNFNT